MELGIFLLEPGGACDQGDFLTPPSLLCTPFPRFFSIKWGLVHLPPWGISWSLCLCDPSQRGSGKGGHGGGLRQLVGSLDSPELLLSLGPISRMCVWGGGEVVGERLQGVPVACPVTHAKG